MNHNYKILYINSLILSSLLTISSSSWFSMWVGLEINLLSIIPLMASNENIFRSESGMKYFITQALASGLLMFSVILINLTDSSPFIVSSPTMIFYSALMMKMGMAPFHFWFPEVLEGLNWDNCLILLTWQKIAPSCVLMYFMAPNQMIAAIIATSTIISSLMGMKQTSIRKILAYSSINHMAWLLAAMMVSPALWLMYFLIYSFTNLAIIILIKKLKTHEINQLNSASSSKMLSKTMFMLNLLSLGGLPPFIGFLPKWLTIMDMTLMEILSMTIMMILFTLITLYFYMRLGFSTFFMKSSKKPKFFKFSLPKWIPIINAILILSLVIIPPLCNTS
uniref:NADH-ubiquinone oxidoreductase chain 2 n=1 Tax=Silvanidae sp. KM-2017 TaxID=2219447 RepID=A0A346RHD4_9CUCU|nr:NADH dehydrogenase subunit 2 [Silvanidae sp. KM-2017]